MKKRPYLALEPRRDGSARLVRRESQRRPEADGDPAETTVDLPEEQAADAARQVRSEATRGVPAASRAAASRLAPDAGEQELEHLRDDRHRGHPVRRIVFSRTGHARDPLRTAGAGAQAP
jgi:hypothetical protein